MRRTVLVLFAVILSLQVNFTKATTKTRSKRFIGAEDVINVVSTMLDLWDLLESKHNFPPFGEFATGNLTINLGFLNRKQEMLTQSVLEISRKLDQLDANLAYNVDFTINAILTAMPKIIRNELRLHSMRDTINQIMLQDRELQRYLQNQSAIERHTLENWALAVSGHHRDSIRNLMTTLHTDIMESPSLFNRIRDMVNILKRVYATA